MSSYEWLSKRIKDSIVRSKINYNVDIAVEIVKWMNDSTNCVLSILVHWNGLATMSLK